MHMGEDVVFAVAVIAGTLTAIAELQIWIICIGLAANGAFMVIAALLLLLFDSLLEVYCLAGMLVLFALGKVMHFGVDEHKEVQQRHQRQYHTCPVAGYERGENIESE